MRFHFVKTSLKTAISLTLVLLLGVVATSAQVSVNLHASPQTTTLPDGNAVPMWGWTCVNPVATSTATSGGGTCGTLAGVPQVGGVWQPPLITVPYSGPATSLTINLTNSLSFPVGAGANSVPTSLVIVGQLGGGLGTTPTSVASPAHAVQGATWPIVGDSSGATFNPPPQPNRVQTFASEVTTGNSASLKWNGLKPGTYLIESGTHPSIQGPMGLYGVLVVTTPPPSTGGTGTAYPGVSYSADIPFLFSEIDPVLNSSINAAVRTAGFSETSMSVLRDTVTSVTVNLDNAGNPIGGSGYAVGNPVTITGGGFTVQATAHVSSVDGSGAITGIAIDNPGKGYTSIPNTVTALGGTGASLSANLSLQGDICSGGAAACYPPAVNYMPLYYLVNGTAFNKTAASASLFAPNPPLGVTGNVLVRMVNAGLRMHIPSIVGSQSVTTIAPATAPAAGFSLIAEDGNVLPGVPRVQSEVFMAAGKTYDVMISTPAAGKTALPIFDRELSLSGNATARDTGMLAYININAAGLPASAALGAAQANADTYNSVVPGNTLNVSDPSLGVIANDVNVFGVKVVTAPGKGTLTLAENGTFSYVPGTGWSGSDTFKYCGNGATTGVACATVTLNAAPIEAGSGITCTNPTTYTSNVSTTLSIKPPGILAFCKDAAGYPLTVNAASVVASSGLTLTVDPNGGFNASVSAANTYSFTFSAQNSQGTVGATSATATIVFPSPSNLAVTVYDPVTKAPIRDYRWVIEEDRTFYVDPTNTTNNGGTSIVPTFGTNFHTSYMPVVATGCTGPLSCESGQTVLGQATVCDIGNGVCRQDGSASQEVAVDPGQVALDPHKRYYISVLPGDAANPFVNGYASAPVCSKDSSGNIDTSSGTCGHGMGGAPVAALCKLGTTCTPGPYPAVTILTQPAPFPPSKLSVFVFEDDFPLNGEQDGGGGIDVLSPNEPGLGGFNITLFDDAGGSGDATGQMTYDMFNMPLGNSLAGTIDPVTQLDACPIGGSNLTAAGSNALVARETTGANGVQGNLGITGTIVTCPKYEADGQTLSPLAGQAVIANLMPGRYGVVATPAADRIARGEEWLQTNTLDGQKAHDSFLRIGEPSFFQEFGPAGYHVSIGFANPGIINARKTFVCNGTDPNITGSGCTNTVTGVATTERMSRTPDERLFSSGDNSSFSFTQCYVSFGDPDGEDFAFTKCNGDGSFTLSGLPDGDWRITIFDQWNDMLVDGLSTPVRLNHNTTPILNMGQIAMNQWQSNIYTKTFFDLNSNGIQDPGEDGLTFVATNNRFRDGSYSNFNSTDLAGNAGFNEIFPLFSWYVIEDDTTRYKSTGTHVVYDAGGPADGTPCGTATTPPTAPCGSSSIGSMMANTSEQISVPTALRVPGARYCASADCPTGDSAGGSTGRVDPPTWFGTEGWQGFSGQNNFVEFGKKPFAPGETGGIHGEVIYASTRPFDDPSLLIHTSWTPDVPGVTVNLYKEGTAPDGTTSLTLIDTTKTSSWDDWAQGFRPDGNPNMNCPGQGTASGTNADLFFFTIYDQPMWLDVYANGGTPVHTIPNNSQYKCYDGMHNWNQVQPAPYDGYYTFPSVTAVNPATGKWTGTNCTGCVPNPDTTDTFRVGTPMLPPGKYVVEMIVPPGYELVKEEDKNILIGDNYIAPVTQQFAGLGNIFILPDQAEINTLYNANNPQNPTQTLGRTTLPSHEGDTGSVETFWPCVGASRVVPDFISLFPQSGEVSPFAGATRNLCDRKEVTLTEQTAALAKFWVFTSAHVAAHFTGVITDDYTSEFDPFSPQFGEKFSPPNLPVSIKDWSGTEVSRVYADQWGTYNGLTYSTWEVNPPNPTGYAPTMMVVCMNDPGPIPGPNGTMITDPLYNPQYSQFCYEIPFMPGQTQYMDTPVVPVSAFAGAGYNNPDCSYPDATPAVARVDGDGGQGGPWASAADVTLTITALGDQTVPNNAYSGPSFTAAPFNAKTITRHYGFGTQCTSVGGTCTAISTVSIGVDASGNPVNAPITSWSDSTIVVTAPSVGGTSGVRQCAIQQQTQYKPAGTSTAYCGQLVITAGNGKQSIDTVTVTIGGKHPTYVAGNLPLLPSGVGSIQKAIDAANPGDLIIVPAGTYNEMLLMWKPVRLQGVGAATTIINANTQPAGKMNVWRQNVDCLFGLAPAGTPRGYDPGCGAGWVQFKPTANNPQVDRLPLEATVGWDATLNGNLAELLQEPTLMGALEGAAITVLSKGVNFPSDPFVADTFPTGTLLLQNVPGSRAVDHCTDRTNPFPSNFECNPSSIDGLGITDSSQGGGGIFVHAWGHNLQIANNRIYNNAGTLSGGINVGQGEFPGAYLGGAGAANADPGSCQASGITNLQLPYCFDMNVNVHNNYITQNSSTGDELFSATPAGAGGISFCTGTDFYKFNYNWLCGNLSSGDGGGLGQLGFVYHADIEHNQVLFNQSTNPTIPTNGGGILIMGAPDVDPTCGATTDQDCVNPVGSAPVGPSDGTGPGLVINANLIMGNSAESGSGGGLRLQNNNGSDVVNFPTTPSRWNDITVTNNVIVNNVAGWDGAGISLQDALNVNIINNTIMSNDTTASSGVLFDTIGAPLASGQGSNCKTTSTTSCPQPAGLVSIQNSTALTSSLPATITCPPNHFSTAGGKTATNGTCRTASYPELYNDVFYDNRSFYIGVGTLGTGTLNQQNVVSLYNAFSTTQAPSQTATGACPAASYWDLGVRGDLGPTTHDSGVTLNPEASLLTVTSADGYTGGVGTTFRANTASNPQVVSQYCNGSRVPPEAGGLGYNVPPGISDATVPNPIFNLTPTATVDEGNNWINISWGPLAETNPVTGAVLGNYAPAANTSPVVNYITALNSSTTYNAAPTTDFFGNLRKTNNAVDIGAIEFAGAAATVPTLSSISPASHTRGGPGFTVTLTGTNLTGTSAVNVSGTGVAVSNIVVVSPTTVTATFTISGTATRNARTVTVTTPGGTSNSVTFTVALPGLTTVSPNSGVRGTAVSVTLTGTNLSAATGINISGTGVTPSGLTVVNDTTVTATFTITSTAGLGNHNVSVVTPGGTTGTLPFTVQGATLASINPTAHTRGGAAFSMTLTGTNLTGATAVTFSGAGVTATGVTVVNSTTVTANVTITAGAAQTVRNVTVATPIGNATLNAAFTVQ